jgi:hypothetical protein
MASVEVEPMESDSGQLIVCHTREEMLEQFEEYKRKTQSGWRCIKSNVLFGQTALFAKRAQDV